MKMCAVEEKNIPLIEIKTWEVAIYRAIHQLFPDREWYEVTKVPIFQELMNGKTPSEVCNKVWNDVEKQLLEQHD